MMSRLPFFWYYPTVSVSQDTGGYLELVKALKEGHGPHFTFRTPGYPVFLWFVTLFTGRWIAVLYIQNLFSYASSLFLVYSVYRFRRSLALPAALAMCGFLGSSQVVLYDIALLSESLYSSAIIVAVALLFLALRDSRPILLSLASAAMAFCILVRPAGLYFGVIYAVVLAYLIWNRAPVRSIVAFLAPFPAILLCLCGYNYATISSFVISPFGEANLAGATALFWEQDQRLPDSVNRELGDLRDSYARQDITPEDLEALRSSWDPDRLIPVYSKAFDRLVYSEGWGIGRRLGSGDYLLSRSAIRQVAFVAIRRHPDLYAKFVWVSMVEFFRGVGYKFDIETSLAYRRRGNPLSGMTGTHPDEAAARLSAAPTRGSTDANSMADRGNMGLERVVKGLQRSWQHIHGALFQTTAWAWAYFIMLFLSLIQLVRFHGRHAGAFLLLALTLIPLGACIVVCLVQNATDRYSYPTQFIYYLSVALMPLLWLQPSAERQTAPNDDRLGDR
jgi:hypothetical protein